MSDQQSYEAVLEEAQTIEEDAVNLPRIPMDVFAQEAQQLHTWAMRDLAELEGAGLDRQWVEDLPVRAGALRWAEGLWNTERFHTQEAQQLWKERSTEAFDLRDTLVHTFFYGFRHNPEALHTVRNIDEGRTYADLIQDLNRLAVAGRTYAGLLAAINFDMTQLDRCAALAEELSGIYAESSTDRLAYREAKIIRDKVAALLKQNVDEVRACGQYLFWRNEDRRRGYTSTYLRRIGKANRQPAETEAQAGSDQA